MFSLIACIYLYNMAAIFDLPRTKFDVISFFQKRVLLPYKQLYESDLDMKLCFTNAEARRCNIVKCFKKRRAACSKLL